MKEWDRLEGMRMKRMRMKRMKKHLKTSKGSIILTGLIAIGCILVLGISTLLTFIGNDKRYQVTATLNTINTIVNQNEQLQAQYEEAYEDEQLIKQLDNIRNVYQLLEDSVDLGEESQEELLGLIKRLVNNMSRLVEDTKKRGFTKESGLYQEFYHQNEALLSEIRENVITDSYIENKEKIVTSMEVTDANFDNKPLIRLPFTDVIPKMGDRNELIVRIVSPGAGYTGRVYINTINVNSQKEGSSGSQFVYKYDFKALQETIGSMVSGKGVQEVSVVKLGTKDSLAIDLKIPGGEKQIVELRLPTEGYDVSLSSKVAADFYFDKPEAKQLAIGVAFDGAYNYEEAYVKYQGMIITYHKSIVAGNVEESISNCTGIMELLTEMLEGIDKHFSKDNKPVVMAENLQLLVDGFNAMSIVDKELVAVRDNNRNTIVEMFEQIELINKETLSQIEQSKFTIMAMLVLMLLTLAGAVILIVIINSKRTRRNLDTLQDTLQMLSEGNLEARLPEDDENEFTQIAVLLNEYINKLKEDIGSIKLLSKELFRKNASFALMARQVVKGMNEQDDEMVENGVLQLERLMGSIVEGVNEQTNHVEVTNEVFESIATVNTEILDEMVKSSVTGRDTLIKITGSKHEIASLLKQMDVINSSVNKANEEIALLLQDAATIEDVLVAIEKLAKQTNLLSLNASIEAARAGEHGKGFAVVAHQVQALSDNTAEQTGKIGALIESIHNKINYVQHANEAVVDTVTVTLIMVDKFAKMMEGVEVTTTEFNDKIIELQEQIKGQISDANKVKAALRSVNKQTEAIKERTNSTNMAAEELSVSLSDSTVDLQDIQMLCKKLNLKLKQFNL